jgi:hypothetical protein
MPMSLRPIQTAAISAALVAAAPIALFEPDRAHAQTTACPGLKAHVVLHEYDGPLTIDLCVEPQGFTITGDTVSLRIHDPYADDLFHSEFDPLP